MTTLVVLLGSSPTSRRRDVESKTEAFETGRNTVPDDQADPPEDATEGSAAEAREHTSPSDVAHGYEMNHGMGEGAGEIKKSFGTHASDAGDAERENSQIADDAEAQRDRAANAAAAARRAETEPSSRPTVSLPGGCLVSVPMLVAAAFLAVSLVGLVLWQVGGSDDDPTEPATAGEQDSSDDAPPVATGDDSSTADVAAPSNEECDGAPADGVDSRFAANCVKVLLDSLGVVWASFPLGWGEVPPCCIKSGFLRALIAYNPTVELGWETHDGVETVLGDPAEAYILDNGNVIFSTGLSPTAPYELDIDVDFASWLEEADPVVSGSHSESIDSELIGPGDPFVDFGGQPIFDLVANAEMAPS